MASRTSAGDGFTLIELLVVLAIVALLSTVAAPRLMSKVDQGKETVLKENLHLTRGVIQRFYRDQRRYPASLAELVELRYLRAIPVDPLTGSAATWVPIAPEQGIGVADVRSGAAGTTRTGTPFGTL